MFSASGGRGADPIKLVSRPVGFLRIAVPSNAPVLVSSPFLPLNVSTAMPGAEAQVVKWDAQSGYETSRLSALEYVPGEGFWVDGRKTGTKAVYLAGEVMLSPSNTAVLEPGLNLVGYPYAGGVSLGETALAGLTDRVEILDAAAQPPAANEPVQGKGYWVRTPAEDRVVWTEVRPYEDRFSSNGSLPQILGVEVQPDGKSVTLSIECKGDETLDVFYQDATVSNGFDAATGWTLAARSVSANAQRLVTWVDEGSADRAPASEIVGRYYVVARAGVDTDGDGTADAREKQATEALDGSRGVAIASISSEVLATASEETVNPQAGTNAPVSKGTNMIAREPPQCILGRIIYVDRNRGKDHYSGRVPTATSSDGPKRSIAAGLSTARAGDTLVIREGSYHENMDISGRDVTVSVEGNVDVLGVAAGVNGTIFQG